MTHNTEKMHSRVTGSIRLLLALWLIFSAVRTLADPHRAVEDQAQSMGVVLPLAGLYFALGAFLLTGFMSRVAGLIMVGLGVWELASPGFGFGVVPVVLAVLGVYFALRGGGAWAMDIYVQKMQERARKKALSSPESM